MECLESCHIIGNFAATNFGKVQYPILASCRLLEKPDGWKNYNMGNWSEQQEANKERKEKDKTRRDKLAGYFFNLSQLTFVALVLGGVTPLYTNIEVGINWYILVAGITLTIILANIGNLILK